MKQLISYIRPAIVSTFILAALCCGLYPLAVTGIAKLAFADKANGSLIVDKDGVIIGSSLIGQNFSGEKYFHPRPSAAGANGYDAASSSGSNLGPTSQKLADQLKERIAAYRLTNGLTENQMVPADAVTASASGLDPHISEANAAMQANRVAQARSLSVEKVRELIAANTDKADFGFLGVDGVNVLKLNLALDAIVK
jgi:K+-transporting ATPase ATPase C chain